MHNQTVTIHVQVNDKIFRRFALYDTFRLRRRMNGPLMFASLFFIFGVICFVLRDKPQAGMLGIVLMAIGLILPGIYVWTFLRQVKGECRKMHLDRMRPVYTLTLAPEKITVVNDMKREAEVTLPYKTLTGVWRDKNAFYLYANTQRAFILPDGQADVSPTELYDILKARLPEKKLFGKRP